MNSRTIIATVALGTGLSAVGHATAITAGSQLQLVGGATVNLTSIIFTSIGGTPNLFNVSAAGTLGDFVPYIGQTGSIQNLTRAGEPVGPANSINVPDFMVLPVPGLGNVHFTLTSVTPAISNPGYATPCPTGVPNPGTKCVTDPGSPFTLQNQMQGNSISTLVGFTADGFVYKDSAATGTSPFRLIFSTQVPQPIETLVPSILAGGSTTNSFSGTAVVTVGPVVPEPGSIALLGSGLLLVGLLSRKFAAKHTA